MLRSARALTQRFFEKDRWQGRAHRTVWTVCAALLALYLSFVTFLAGSPVLSGTMETVYSLVWFVAYAGALFAGLMWLCGRVSGGRWLRAEKQRLCPLFFAASMGLSLLILGIWFLSCYPGAVSYDVYNQWTQMETGLFNGWHPVFNTLLMWLGTRLVHSYPWLVGLQIVCFSAALAYLAATLYSWGIPKGALLVFQGLTVASALVGNAMMYVWKDNAMTLGVVLLSAWCVNLYASRGKWLQKPLNAVLLGLVLAYTTLVRHNGMLFTVPLLICLLLCYRAQMKRLLLAAGVMALSLALVMGPLYGALDIVQPDNTLEESVGIPMTILFDARLKNPDALDAETAAFLEGLVPDDVFAAKYKQGNYNSVKFEYPREYISKTPAEALLRMTGTTIRNDPRNAFEAVCSLTDLVWDVTGNNEGVELIRNSGDMEAYRYQHTHLNQIGKSLQKLVQIPLGLPLIRWLFENIGVQMALLLVCTLWALRRNGPWALTLCAPTLLYNLATMLLLCGNDARFFQFSMVVSIPAMLVLCQQMDGEAEEAQVA